MKEIADILGEVARLRESGEVYALATVVKVRGSAYRRPGARMLVRSDGRSIGAISGGCLEGEVIQRSLQVIETGEAVVQIFEMGEDDHIMGYGSGCGGDVHVLIEREPEADRVPSVALLKAGYESRSDMVLATVIGGEPEAAGLLGIRAAFLHDGRILGDLRAVDGFREIRSHAGDLLHAPRPHIHGFTQSGHRLEVLFEVLHPPIQLVLLGDGPDIRPVVRMGRELGWRVVVIGRKPITDLRARFPEATEHVFLMHPEDVLAHVALDPSSAVVTMTHNFIRDRDLLAQLVPSAARYIGMLGPRERTDRLLEELESQGAGFTEPQLERLYAPVGLDLGTEAPEEIALSIVAEVQSVFAGRSGVSLRDRQGPIHEPVPLT